MQRIRQRKLQTVEAVEVEFRTARLDDSEALVGLVNGSYRGTRAKAGWTTEADYIAGQRVDSEMIKELLASPVSAVLVAELPGKTHGNSVVVGCVHVQCLRAPEDSGKIQTQFGLLSVAPHLQKLGIGDRLLAKAEEFARQEFASQEMAMYVISIRDSLIAWYERRGYRLTGARAPFPYGQLQFGQPLREDLEFVVMSKTL